MRMIAEIVMAIIENIRIGLDQATRASACRVVRGNRVAIVDEGLRNSG
jgi:hypothetical protein